MAWINSWIGTKVSNKPSDYNAGSPKINKKGIHATVETDTICTQLLFVTTIDLSDYSDTIYSYLYGRFPFTLLLRNKYFFVMYEYNSKSILVSAMKTWTNSEMYRVFEKKVSFVNKQGSRPKL